MSTIKVTGLQVTDTLTVNSIINTAVGMTINSTMLLVKCVELFQKNIKRKYQKLKKVNAVLKKLKEKPVKHYLIDHSQKN